MNLMLFEETLEWGQNMNSGNCFLWNILKLLFINMNSYKIQYFSISMIDNADIHDFKRLIPN